MSRLALVVFIAFITLLVSNSASTALNRDHNDLSRRLSPLDANALYAPSVTSLISPDEAEITALRFQVSHSASKTESNDVKVAESRSDTYALPSPASTLFSSLTNLF